MLTDKISERLVMIESFVKAPPETEFQRGYLFALMEEAVDDIDEAGSDIFDAALQMFKDRPIAYDNWFKRRAKTLA